MDDINDLEDFFVSESDCSAEKLIAALDTFTEISKKTGIEDPLVFKDLLSGAAGSALFRRSGSAKHTEIFLWLSQIQRFAEVVLATGKVKKFQGLSNDDLKEISRLSLSADNLEVVSSSLWKYGIIVVYLPQSAGMKTDGAFFKLRCGTPVIGMTLRYDRYDYFWFTLMHELAHITLHYDQFQNPHFDCIEELDDDVIELQANQLARDTFVSRSDWRSASVRRRRSEEELFEDSRQLLVHPAILAGLVRYETGNYTIFNRVIHEISIKGMISKNA